MDLLSRIFDWFRAIRNRRFERRSEAWLKARRRDVLESLMNDVSPIAGKPYIIGGTYEWYVEQPIELDYFFPNASTNPGSAIPVAVKITGPYHKPFDQLIDRDVPRAFWESELESDSFVVDVCSRASIPILLITPNDPVDPHSLAVRLRSLIK